MSRRFAGGFACRPSTLTNRDIQHPDDLSHSVPPSHLCAVQKYYERRAGNLGLTASGLFTRFNVTHVSIRTSDTSSNPLESPSQAYRTLPYHSHCCESALSVIDLAPLHLPRMRTRSVSYYAFFEGWLLLSQLPDCLSLHTSFST